LGSAAKIGLLPCEPLLEQGEVVAELKERTERLAALEHPHGHASEQPRAHLQPDVQVNARRLFARPTELLELPRRFRAARGRAEPLEQKLPLRFGNRPELAARRFHPWKRPLLAEHARAPRRLFELRTRLPQRLESALAQSKLVFGRSCARLEMAQALVACGDLGGERPVFALERRTCRGRGLELLCRRGHAALRNGGDPLLV